MLSGIKWVNQVIVQVEFHCGHLPSQLPAEQLACLMPLGDPEP